VYKILHFQLVSCFVGLFGYLIYAMLLPSLFTVLQSKTVYWNYRWKNTNKCRHVYDLYRGSQTNIL